MCYNIPTGSTHSSVCNLSPPSSSNRSLLRVHFHFFVKKKKPSTETKLYNLLYYFTVHVSKISDIFISDPPGDDNDAFKHVFHRCVWGPGTVMYVVLGNMGLIRDESHGIQSYTVQIQKQKCPPIPK